MTDFVLNLDARQPSLRQLSNHLLQLAQRLVLEHDVPHAVAEELSIAATRCYSTSSHLECVLESLEDYRQQQAELASQLERDLARLRRECPPDELAPLRPDRHGSYAWDRWEAQAVEMGLSPDLAGLGRAVMREAVQHAWDEPLKAECGWRDDGQAMLELAQRDGAAAAERWKHLLETDGERGRWKVDGSWSPFEEDR